MFPSRDGETGGGEARETLEALEPEPEPELERRRTWCLSENLVLLLFVGPFFPLFWRKDKRSCGFVVV